MFPYTIPKGKVNNEEQDRNVDSGEDLLIKLDTDTLSGSPLNLGNSAFAT